MPVIAGAKLREGTTTILPSGRALQGVGLSSMRFHPIGGARTNQGPLGGLSGGLEPCRCSRPARDAAPTITPTIFWSDRLAADAGPGRRRSQLPQIRPDALEAPDFVGTGEKPARQDGQRGRRSGGGSVLGYLASWHDRGPGGRHDDGARSRGRGHPRPQTGLDRKWQ